MVYKGHHLKFWIFDSELLFYKESSKVNMLDTKNNDILDGKYQKSSALLEMKIGRAMTMFLTRETIRSMVSLMEAKTDTNQFFMPTKVYVKHFQLAVRKKGNTKTTFSPFSLNLKIKELKGKHFL